MASGFQHKQASIAAAPIAGVAAAIIFQDVLFGTLVFVGCLLGIILTPDLDLLPELDNWNVSGLWKLYWYPYARMIPHRGDVSHIPLLGTAVRLVYLLMPFTIAAMVLQFQGIPVLFYLINFSQIMNGGVAVFVGLVVSDTLHWLMDI